MAWRSRLVEQMQQIFAWRNRLVQRTQQFCNVLFSMLHVFGLVLILWTVSCFGSLKPVVNIIRVSDLLPLLDIQVPNHSLVKTLIKQFDSRSTDSASLQIKKKDAL